MEKKFYGVVRPSGAIEYVDAPNTTTSRQLVTLQSLVGGYIEVVNCVEQDRAIVINDEGLLALLPLNKKAEDLVNEKITPSGLRTKIRGVAVYCKVNREDLEGMTKDELDRELGGEHAPDYGFIDEVCERKVALYGARFDK